MALFGNVPEKSSGTENVSVLQNDSGDEACDVRWHIGWLWGCRRVKLNLWERRFGENQGCFSRPGARWRAGFCQFTLTRRAPLDLCRNSPNSSTGDQSRPHHRLRAHETFPWLSSLTRVLFLFSLVISQCCFQRKIIIIYQRNLFDLFWLENNDTAVAIIDSFSYFRSSDPAHMSALHWDSFGYSVRATIKVDLR